MAARLDLSCLLGRGLLKAPDLPNTSGAKYTRYVQLLYGLLGPERFLLSYSRDYFPLRNPRAPYTFGSYDKPNNSIPHPPYLTEIQFRAGSSKKELRRLKSEYLTHFEKNINFTIIKLKADA